MKLPNFKRLFYTDFPKDYQSLIEQLSYTVNNAFDGIFSALNNNISLRDNILSVVKDLTLTVNANGIPLSTAAFSIGTNTKPIDGLIIIKATSINNNTIVPTSGVFATYSQNGSTVTLTNITGLPANSLFH